MYSNRDTRDTRDYHQDLLMKLTRLNEQLVTQPIDEYDPEDWSIVCERERQQLREVVSRMSTRDLSIGRILVAANLPETASREQFVKGLIIERFNCNFS